MTAFVTHAGDNGAGEGRFSTLRGKTQPRSQINIFQSAAQALKLRTFTNSKYLMHPKRKVLTEADGNTGPLKQLKLSFITSVKAPQTSGVKCFPLHTWLLAPHRPAQHENQLLVMKASQEACTAFVSLINLWASAPTNQSLPPIIWSLTDGDPTFPRNCLKSTARRSTHAS